MIFPFHFQGPAAAAMGRGGGGDGGGGKEGTDCGSLPVSSLKVLEKLIFYFWKKKSRRKSEQQRTLLLNLLSSSLSLVILLSTLFLINSSISIPSVSCQKPHDAPQQHQPQRSRPPLEDHSGGGGGEEWSRRDARARLLASLPRQPRHRGRFLIIISAELALDPYLPPTHHVPAMLTNTL